MMRRMVALVAVLFVTRISLSDELDTKVWIHGSPDCGSNRDPAIDVFRYDAATYILRQNKCVHYEAPFIYVLFGERMVFVQDTGATEDPGRFPLREVLDGLIERERPAATEPLPVLVTHSHSHRDHTAADAQFHNRPSVTIVEPTADAVRAFFGFENWPEGRAVIDLGGRELTVLPIPGHQSESVAVYDSRTGWLLTGDTVYPGQLYVWDWDAYRASIRRLVEFSKTRSVSALMGTHIEMSNTPGRLYAIGSTFQPDEAPLRLEMEDLLLLDGALQSAGGKPRELTMTKFVVTPLSGLQRTLSRGLRWLRVR